MVRPDQMLFSYLAEKNAKYHPAKDYLVEVDRRLSFGRFNERTNQLARGLLARGLRPGDRVCVLNHNASENVEVFFAAMKAGGAFCPLNVRLAPPEVAAILDDARPALLVAGREYLDKLDLGRLKAAGCQVLALGPAASPGQAYEAALEGEPAARLETERRDDDLAALIYTSGTTGRPKGVMWTHRNLFSSAQASAISRRTRPEDVALLAAPIYQAAGVGTLLSSTFRGNTVVLLGKFDTAAYLATIEREKVTTAFLVPVMLQKLLECPELDRYDLSSLRTICYGSAPMPAQTLRRAMARFDWQFMGACGATETSPGYIAFLGHQDHVLDGSPEMEKRLGSIGQESINAEVRVFDEQDQELPPEAVGEIVLRGTNVMAGYWRQPEQTADVLRGGWYHTGDLGYLDRQGYLFLVDRKKDMIISGGFNVYPKEIEDALLHHPAVAQAAVAGRGHPVWGETTVAFVVPRPGAPRPSEAELLALLKERLADYKQPRGGIHFVEELPLNASGKVVKQELKKLYPEKFV
ncbi:MAG: long-chain-fatty-acid--CoA ligase [Desulfarculus sp.]|nr:MAG: long-chain-fatty-acid--CoA ligase [Desulfarculus sp.]